MLWIKFLNFTRLRASASSTDERWAPYDIFVMEKTIKIPYKSVSDAELAAFDWNFFFFFFGHEQMKYL